ncbi:hypothetical protein SEA_KRAMPUS_70 [Microbacterium phage Krampus]|uniref:Uncharacterized protein n=6 Tax=Krampusvirus krampus TaxID=2734242 RepID=A0A4Y6EI19_9CAUD|nr:hypothetical protein HOT40_gp70 [Microbacterium phage Krampus]AWY04525.1 hypothetical protein SEA_ANNASERENA_70 [Microbacterium phage AnnaSerena]QDF18122.1 hypothetical protein SEA_ANAKIN_70 [Microbacterium phage Anakin]QDF18204.1 hypothetical protein SEA_NARUTORUN_70 [Microbacterium phage NarutoRun]UDG78689.1 hypothetical protein SEA_NEPTUNE_70 [Microbacterium phage Neptune]URP21736.1 hypothetical protein SEA_KATE_70 [Microbacterium phage Kate]USH45267.1 hypothetical protein SEA_POTTY_69 
MMAETEYAEKLSAIWDGEQHWFELGVLFPATGAAQTIIGFEDLEEEEELSPFESPSRTPILHNTAHSWDNERYRERFPLQRAEQAWGAFSISLTAFATIAEIDKKQYQHVWPGIGSEPGVVKWSFTTDEHITERM